MDTIQKVKQTNMNELKNYMNKRVHETNMNELKNMNERKTT